MKNKKKLPGNRSPKTDEPKRFVTIALPEKILSVLETYDQDLAQAIVKVTEHIGQRTFTNKSSYEIVKVAPCKSVFVVGSNTKLAMIPWLKLVEIAPGRNLITIPSGTSLESLQIAILELIENMSSDEIMDQTLLKDFCKYIGRLRRNNKMSTVEILIVDTDE